MTLLAALAGASVLCSTAVIACSSDPGYSSSSSSSGAVPDGGPSSDAEAGLPQPNDALCKGLVIGPRVIAEVGENMSTPPPLGGTIALGTYDLDAFFVYGAFDAGASDGGEQVNEVITGRSGTATLVVTRNTLAFVETYGPTGALPAPTTTGYAFSAEGTEISEAKVCPETAPTRTMPYTAVGSSLALFVDPTHRLVFQKRPEP
ncbi:MAG TPA: hypothetical protein VLT33_34640 [Labilithrix sp.]|nr:hypothetical protein [Labilithrix sp.]